MSPSAHVLAIHALEELRGALGRFGGEAGEALRAAEQEIRRTLEWLQERQAHWQREVRRRQEAVRRARAALERCQASARHDPKTGRSYVPDCSAYQNALVQAQVRLREAEAELQNVREWSRLVQQAVADYQRQAQRLGALLGNDLPKATALLGQKITTLQSYVAMTAPSGGRGSTAEAVPPGAPSANVQTQQAFRQAMAGLTPQERGWWGEQTVLREAHGYGHRILLEHAGAATTRGYDCVSWDGTTLHIWEAKNYSASDSGQAGVVQDLSALDPKRRRASVEQFLRDLPLDDPHRAAIIEAIQQDQVQWHIRLGPDTDISFTPLENLEWGYVDAQWYSYDEMMDAFTSQELGSSPTRPVAPPEIREGSVGGPERGG